MNSDCHNSVNAVQLRHETHLIGTSTCFESQAVIIRNVLLIVGALEIFELYYKEARCSILGSDSGYKSEGRRFVFR
jgi:hypothetical protein